MAKETVAADFETMSYSARVRFAVELGRKSRTNPKTARLLKGWQSGGFSLRLLSAFACCGSRDSATLAMLTADPSRTISHTALILLCNVGDDDTLLAVLKAIPPRIAARALFKLRHKRPIVVDRFVADRAMAGDSTAWMLVPLGSDAILDRYFETAAECGGTRFWRRLSIYRPARAASEMIARLVAATSPDGLLFANAHITLALLSRKHPDEALTVVTALQRHIPLASISLQKLVGSRPIAIADLVLESSDNAAISFERVAHRLGVARIVSLFRRIPTWLGNPDQWLKQLPAGDRDAIYRELRPAWTAANGTIPIAIIRRLPTATRQSEARRMFALPVFAARPLEKLPYAGLLPWEETRDVTKTWLGHPEAENRAAALLAHCEAARFDRTRLAELLELLIARKHEQDPVRQLFLDAIASLPPGRWLPEQLPALTRIVRDALDAADLSYVSITAIGKLIFSILPFHVKWTVEQLATVTRERGFPTWTDRLLTPEEVRRIAPPLTPIIEKWLDREHEGQLIALATIVGKRLPVWPKLVAVLEKLVCGAVLQYIAAAAMSLLIKHHRKDRERIITAALTRDESWVLHSPVMDFLHLRRQELLTPFLGQRAYAGRFSTGRVRHVLPFESGFYRWTDAQQELFCATLTELTQPPKRKKDAQVTSDVLRGVRILPELPAIGPEWLIVLSTDKRPAVLETAVRALGRLDARQGISELLIALGDARARYAVYALRTALSDLPPSRILEVMQGVPLGKVTVAKEAIRLAGEFGGAAALVWFEELDRRKLHKDVRAALLRALWDHLERPEAWAILDSAIASTDMGVVIGLARIQVDRASVAARERVADLLRRLLDHPEPTVRVAVLNRLGTQPVPDPRRVLLNAVLAKLASTIPDERSAGLTAALAAATDADAAIFATAFTQLLDRKRELAASVAEFADRTLPLGTRLVEVRTAVLAAMEAEPACVGLQIRLAAALKAGPFFAKWLLKWIGSDRWHAGTQIAAFDTLVDTRQAAAVLESAEAVWAASPDPAARWLAFGVLFRVATEQGWSDERRKRLQHYRDDASPMVCDAARLTFPP